jgi:hypothetical protein
MKSYATKNIVIFSLSLGVSFGSHLDEWSA